MSVDTIGIDRILSQMRVLQAQATGVESISTPIPTSENSFATTLKSTLDQVSDLQNSSHQIQDSFERGDKSLDLAQVMIASQKANIAFQATVQVRNKFVQAYQDIMNMPV